MIRTSVNVNVDLPQEDSDLQDVLRRLGGELQAVVDENQCLLREKKAERISITLLTTAEPGCAYLDVMELEDGEE